MTKIKLDLPDVMRDMLVVLSPQEKEVVTKRFALYGKKKHTLEKIGRNLSLTRERIRQIQVAALKKLSRTLKGTTLRKINTLAVQIVEEHGGVIREEKIVSEIINNIENPSGIDGQIIKLLLSAESKLKKRERSDKGISFWYLSELNKKDIDKTIDSIARIMNKDKNVLPLQDIVRKSMIKSEFVNSNKDIFVGDNPEMKSYKKDVIEKITLELMSIDNRFKETEDGQWGLKKWRHINPRSICDKIYIVLQEEKKPLHFIDIANKIISRGFDKKSVTVQAVHNELIRFEPFVLVGRGLYALKEWGYAEGTVSDIIEDVLKKYKNKVVSKKTIVAEVLEQRDVKISTISLNLQKNDHFVRVGRALYQLDLSKKKKNDSRRGYRNIVGKKKKTLPV